MIPHERSLVEKLKDEPFALIGVNSDPLDAVKKGVAEKKMSWRHFWDGSTSGPIASAWNVHGWPTIYILDEEGVIRAKDLRDAEMEQKVEELLAELKRKKAASGEPKSGG
jgi:peroxiredoxin